MNETNENAELTIERVLLGCSPELSTSISVMGYRTEKIHREAINVLDNLQELCEDIVDNPIGPESKRLDLITHLNSIVAMLMSKSKTETDLHKRASMIHSIDVLHAAVNDLLNKTQNEELIRLYSTL